jgi:heme-degrading monooxygenase HmoA
LGVMLFTLNNEMHSLWYTKTATQEWLKRSLEKQSQTQTRTNGETFEGIASNN